MLTLLYAHGFRSSSQSRKARELADYLAAHAPGITLLTPDLSFDPAIAIEQLDGLCRQYAPEELTIVGSSLGGFYALVLAERFGCRAALLNPSLRPYETLAKHLGPQTNLYSGEAFEFTEAHLATLQSLRVESIANIRNYLLIVEMGDELLDHRDTIRFMGGARMVVVPRGNHDLVSFPRHIPELLAFVTDH